jgi:hypothetical protein
MVQRLDELLARISALQDEIEVEYRKAREELELKRIRLAEDLIRQRRHHKIGLFRFLLRTRFLAALTLPIIHLRWIPFILLDIFVTIYQAICFPVFRIPKVRRADYLIFDREGLPYLTAIEKFNCCSCGNGIAAYAREVAARTEQYCCPIKHARRIRSAHGRYPGFFDHGDAEAVAQGLHGLRRQYGNCDTDS